MLHALVSVCSVRAHLSRSTFVLRKTDAVAFVPHETNGTSAILKMAAILNEQEIFFPAPLVGGRGENTYI
jgi:hypothetical protein